MKGLTIFENKEGKEPRVLWVRYSKHQIYEQLEKRGVHPVVEQEEFAACI